MYNNFVKAYYNMKRVYSGDPYTLYEPTSMLFIVNPQGSMTRGK